MIIFLLEKGVNPLIKNKEGKNALEQHESYSWSQEEQAVYSEIIKFLK